MAIYAQEDLGGKKKRTQEDTQKQKQPVQSTPESTNTGYSGYSAQPAYTQQAAASQPAPVQASTPAATAVAAEPTNSQKLYENYLALVGKMPTYTYSDFSYTPYKSAYDALITAATDKLMNFQYNPDEDQSYLTYKKQYTDAGQTAQEDTLAKLAAKTGGIANSYAVSAAQQQYNNYMNALANKVPELEQLAYDRIQNELGTYQGLDATDYERYLNDRTQNFNSWTAGQDQSYRKYQTEADAYQKQLDYALGRAQAAEQAEASELDYQRQVELSNLAHQQAVQLQNMKAAAAMQQLQAEQAYKLQLAQMQSEQDKAKDYLDDLNGEALTNSQLVKAIEQDTSNKSMPAKLQIVTQYGYPNGALYDVAEQLYRDGYLTDNEWYAMQQKYRVQ